MKIGRVVQANLVNPIDPTRPTVKPDSPDERLHSAVPKSRIYEDACAERENGKLRWMSR